MDPDLPRLAALAAPSRAWAQGLLTRFPQLAGHCRAAPEPGSDGLHLRVVIPSPAGGDRDVTLWMLQGTEPSLGFGPWHTHGDGPREVDDDAWEEEPLLDLLGAILEDRFVIVADAEGLDVLDLRRRDALADHLTSPWQHDDQVEIRSFTGAADGIVRIQDL